MRRATLLVVAAIDALLLLSACGDDRAGRADGDGGRASNEAWPAETMGSALVVEGCMLTACDDACSAYPACSSARDLLPFDCASCLDEACCAEQRACTDDAACAGLLVCATVCDGDAACVAGCEEDFPTAIAEHDALSACQAATCAEECAP